MLRSVQIDYMLERGYALDVPAGFLSCSDRGLELAKVDGELAGFAAWYVTEDPREAKLDKLYVLPTHQRHGLGGRLIERVEELARRVGAVTLILNVNKTMSRRSVPTKSAALRSAKPLSTTSAAAM